MSYVEFNLMPEHKITKEDRSFNAFLVVVFVITVIVLLSIFITQSAAA